MTEPTPPTVHITGTTPAMRRLYRELRNEWPRRDARLLCIGAANIGWGATDLTFT